MHILNWAEEATKPSATGKCQADVQTDDDGKQDGGEVQGIVGRATRFNQPGIGRGVGQQTQGDYPQPDP